MPVNPDSRIACAHCGKLCLKVYEVTRDQDGHTFLIGPSCCKKNLFGWEPEKQVAREMEKAAEKLAKSRAHQVLVDMAAPIVESVASLPTPEIVCTGTKYSHVAYGIADSNVSLPCRDGLTPERIRCIADSWKREQVRLLVASLENSKKREKVFALACGELRV